MLSVLCYRNDHMKIITGLDRIQVETLYEKLIYYVTIHYT